jgi:branched-chain amino acid transport system substrate-binding protein
MKMNFKLVFAASVAATLAFAGCRKSDSDKTVREVQIAGMFSLSGNWSTLGLNSEAAIELAADDVNAYFDRMGTSYRIRTRVYDTKLDTALALNFMKEAYRQNIKYVVGPQSSAEVGAIKSYADENNMIVVSQGSTAGTLAMAGDNIFRFCPSDALEGVALAKSIYASGKRALVTLSRDDAGNKGLQQSVARAFQELGGTVVSLIPYSTELTDFSSVTAEVKNRIITLNAVHAASEVAVYLASFDECVALFKAAAAHEELMDVNWYGADGVALSSALTADTEAAAFAAATGFFAPAFGLPADAESKWKPLAARIEARTGLAPDAFALAAYDAVWVWALNVASLPSYSTRSFSDIKSNFIQQANSYYGATGATLLNAAGDRSIGSFDYWGIVEQNGSYTWKLVGRSE